MFEPKTIFLLFLSALCISSGGTWLLLRSKASFGMDSPDGFRKQHTQATLRLGGLPIFTALCGGFVLLGYRLPDFATDWLPVIIGNALIFSVGFLDDLKPLGARIKLLGQVGAALIVYSLGVSIDSLTNPFGEGSLVLGYWSLPITILWLVAIPNIINLIDGMDGLATGFGMFLCLTLAAIGFYSQKMDVVLVATMMGGGLAGFLIFNFPPAKIFLGDGGAYLIGFFVASTSLMSSNKGSIMASLLVMAVALGIPILDTAFAITRRAIRGVPIFRADAEHIHHRLITLGYSKSQALIALYSICLVLSVAGISILLTKGQALPIAGAFICLLALASARYLGYVRNWSDLRKQFSGALKRRREFEYIRCHGTLLEMEIERCHSPEEFAPLLFNTLKRLGLSIQPFPGASTLTIKIEDATRIAHLYQFKEMPNDDSAHIRAESIGPALTSALEKWGNLPGIRIDDLRNPIQEN